VGWLEEIDATLARSPGFFEGKPVVLDLSAVDLSQTAIAHLVSSLDQRNIRILGIEGVEAVTSHLEHAASAYRRTPLHTCSERTEKA
jgi:septum formation inhibitor MinC